ncbi:WhiB family transcriptional regulator [Gordonia alkaliphila]|uniref:WhiB family transcriptional regulator n=1 Tax=Gordonia alkaliphila TaxID=1053547 RepID=UPI001FF5136E|nr:WhiB family transcriptional regulator [Gordonia alkaliphila]MCK0441175.1 WhiB family transcriptional regulator [Gordonia alkaliphila]
MSSPTGQAVPQDRQADALAFMRANWNLAAGCKGVDTELFFDRPSWNKETLEPLCQSCPVIGNCFTSMMPLNTDKNVLLHGFWGGINAEPITGKVLKYIQAIARGAASGPAGDEVAYIATRFLMERIGTEIREEGEGTIDDELFDELIGLFGAASQRRLEDLVRLAFTDSARAADLYGADLIDTILRISGRRANLPTAL